MALSSDQATALADAYNQGMEAGHFGAAQSLADQWGVTYSDVEQAFPGFDISTLNPSISLGGERGGGGGAGGGGLSAQDISDLVSGAYGSIGFTNTADPNYGAGVNYWTSQLSSGALTPYDFSQAFLSSASSITDPNYAQYVSNAQNLINQYTTNMDFINANVGDPVLTTQWLKSQGYTPEDVLAAQRYSVGANAPTLEAIQNYWNQGLGGYEARFGDILTSTFGDAASREAFTDMLATQQGLDPDKYSFSDLINAGQFSDMSIEDITNALQTGSLNQYQDALTVANLAQNYFGLSKEDAGNLVNDLLSGESDNQLAKNAFDELLRTNTLSDETRFSLLQSAASSNPEAPIFQQNPEFLTIFSPTPENIEGGKLAGGQLGYVNGAPIISLSELQKQMGDSNQLSSSQDRRIFDYGSKIDDKFGWNIFSKYAGDIRTGAALYGIEGKPSEVKTVLDIGDKYAKLEEEGKVQAVRDPESGEINYLINAGTYEDGSIKWETPASFFNTSDTKDENATVNGMQNFQTYQDSIGKLDNAARQLGLNPADYKSSSDLYNAINEKETRFLVTGNTASWDPTKTGGIGGGGVDTGAGEHARVLYQQIGDKLVPIKVMDTFELQDPKTSGLQAQLGKYAPLISLATLPFGGIGGLLQTAGMTAGQAALASAALSTAASGGDFGDFAKSFITQQYVVPQVSSMLGEGLGSLDLGLDASTIQDISKFGAGALGTAITGGSMEEYALNRGLSILADSALAQAGIDTNDLTPAARAVLQSMLPTILKGGDMGKALFNTAMNIGQRSIAEQQKLDRRTETPI